MFNNSKKENGMKIPGPSKGTAPSLLSSDLVVTGNLESDGDMQIDGTIAETSKVSLLQSVSQGLLEALSMPRK